VGADSLVFMGLASFTLDPINLAGSCLFWSIQIPYAQDWDYLNYWSDNTSEWVSPRFGPIILFTNRRCGCSKHACVLKKALNIYTSILLFTHSNLFCTEAVDMSRNDFLKHAFFDHWGKSGTLSYGLRKCVTL
jgi:hypothetical protein